MTNTELLQLFGLRVQALRRRRGLTQEGLAEAIERSVDTVSNIERGLGGTRLETVLSIADAVGVTAAELFEFGQDPVGDREHRRAIEQIIGMLANSDDHTLQAVIDMVRIILRVRAPSEGERP